MYKKCSKCKEEKLFSEFSKDKNRKDGYYPKCKNCTKEYRVTNKSKLAVKKVEYYLTNKNKILTRQSEYRMANRDLILKRDIDYYIANKDRILERQLRYYKINKKQILKYTATYRKLHKNKIMALNAKRRAVKLSATPNWLTTEDFERIAELYTCTQMFRLYTGQEYHVDHIVPLQGKDVCGLHVPWNLQVILASENLRKSNKLLQ
jgi:5-methylcytosine-specific restriction endonuclease McrA